MHIPLLEAPINEHIEEEGADLNQQIVYRVVVDENLC